MKKVWWKVFGVGLVFYALIYGILSPVPALPILHETIRNLYFHVTMWFAMIIIMIVSAVNSIKSLSSGNLKHDILASEAAHVGTLLGILGVATGSLWAKNTWGAWWTNDAKLNGAAVSLLFYFAYILLRDSIKDQNKKARISAIYNIFAFVMMFVFIMILPRLTDSLHPGNGGNPAFGKYDLDSNMRMVFYPAVIGWVLLSLWILDVKKRLAILTQKENEK